MADFLFRIGTAIEVVRQDWTTGPLIFFGCNMNLV